MADNTPQPQGVTFIPISLIGDTNPVTQNATVNFTATVPDGSEPSLTLGFYERHSLTADTAITVATPPVPVWNNGVATFSLTMNAAIFSQLSSGQTNFAVTAKIPNVNSGGECVFAIDLDDNAGDESGGQG